MSVSLPSQVRSAPRVLFQELDGKVILLDSATERYFGLDTVGSRLWQGLVVERESPSLLVARLRLEYAVEEAVLRRDVAAFIEQLRTAGFIEVIDDV